MGRELKRVALDFDWPVDKTWEGYLNPLYLARKCVACDGDGNSRFGKTLHDRWYGNAPFKPEDRGSVPYTPEDEVIWRYAAHQCGRDPSFYGNDDFNIRRNAQRLCALFNKSWCHHLNQDDVDALIAAGRLRDFTREWLKKEGDERHRWYDRDPVPVVTAKMVNDWAIGGMGHDSINCWVVCKAEGKRLKISLTCPICKGHGDIWPSKEARKAYEDWEKIEPPAGPGYQIWQTVSEGSPISPVFETAEKLARHMAETRWGADRGTSFEQWMKFIEGPGWAPTLIMQHGEILSGVDAV